MCSTSFLITTQCTLTHFLIFFTLMNLPGDGAGGGDGGGRENNSPICDLFLCSVL